MKNGENTSHQEQIGFKQIKISFLKLCRHMITYLELAQ